MEDNLIALLESFKYPVIRQGSLAPEDAYPDTFFTFWNNSETGLSFYDDKTQRIDFDYSVNVYSTNPETVYSLLSQARSLLKENGWNCYERGYDVRSDEITHTGRGMRVFYLYNNNLKD